ncbi:MAG: YcgN family cysteine cluster protein [Spartobacteria bacterium]|nr:YcgN family cysteine cluster protein [Spartobacteria bacterium]
MCTTTHGCKTRVNRAYLLFDKEHAIHRLHFHFRNRLHACITLTRYRNKRSRYTMTHSQPEFWKHKKLHELSAQEWELLCDRCGKCCYHKIIDPDTEEVIYLDTPCQLLDAETGLCKDYANRHQTEPDCGTLTPETVMEYDWLPETCAYRRIGLGRPLPASHPLLQSKDSTS